MKQKSTTTAKFLGAWLKQRAKSLARFARSRFESTFFEIFSSLQVSFGGTPTQFFFKCWFKSRASEASERFGYSLGNDL